MPVNRISERLSTELPTSADLERLSESDFDKVLDAWTQEAVSVHRQLVLRGWPIAIGISLLIGLALVLESPQHWYIGPLCAIGFLIIARVFAWNLTRQMDTLKGSGERLSAELQRRAKSGSANIDHGHAEQWSITMRHLTSLH